MPKNSVVEPIPVVAPAQDEMPPALRKACEKADKLVHGADANFLKARYELGKIVSEVEKNVKNSYGSRAVDKMSNILGVNKNILYKTRRFTELYDQDDLSQIVQARGKNGRSINWTHMEILVTVEDDKVRNDLTEKVLTNGWSGKELGKEVQALFGGSRSNSNGRPMNKPKDFAGYLDSIIAVAEAVKKKTDTVWLAEEDNMFDAALAVLDVNEPLIDKMQETLDELANTVLAVEQVTKELNDIREELLSRAEAAKKQAKSNDKAFRKDEIDDDEEELSDEDKDYEDDGKGLGDEDSEDPDGEDEDGEDEEDPDGEDEDEFTEDDAAAETEVIKKVAARSGTAKLAQTGSRQK